MENNIANIKKSIVPILKIHEVKRASIFGSVATGKNKRGSDIDILIEFKGRKTLFDLSGLYGDLEEKLKRKVDLVTYKSIDPRFKESILASKVDIL